MSLNPQDSLDLPRILPYNGQVEPLTSNIFSSRLKKELRLVHLGSKNLYYFFIADQALLASLDVIYRNLPGDKIDAINSHALVAEIINIVLEIRAGKHSVSDSFRAKVLEHLAYHEQIIAKHTPTSLDGFSAGLQFDLSRSEDLRFVELSITELLNHLVAESQYLGHEIDLPNVLYTGTLEKHSRDLLAAKGVILTPGQLQIGTRAVFEPTCRISTHIIGFSGRLGAFSFSNSGIPIRVHTIGRYCSIAHHVVFGAAEHPLDRVSTSPFSYDPGWIFGAHLKRTGTKFESYSALKSEKRQDAITIGNDVWIGQNVYIRGGVTIGDGAVVGTGSVVTRDVGPYEIVAGVPAKLIRRRFSESISERLIASAWWTYAFPDFDGLSFQDPSAFLEGLQRRIDDGVCKPYVPVTISGAEISKLLHDCHS